MQTDSTEELGGVGLDEGAVAAIEVGTEEVDGGEEVGGGEDGEEVDGGVDRGKEGQQELGFQEVLVIPKEDQETVSEVKRIYKQLFYFLKNNLFCNCLIIIMSLSTFVVLNQATLDILCPYKGWRLYFSEGMCVTT